MGMGGTHASFYSASSFSITWCRRDRTAHHCRPQGCKCSNSSPYSSTPFFRECGDGQDLQPLVQCGYLCVVNGNEYKTGCKLLSKAPGRAALGIVVQQKQVTITHQVINDDLWLGVVTDVTGCC